MARPPLTSLPIPPKHTWIHLDLSHPVQPKPSQPRPRTPIDPGKLPSLLSTPSTPFQLIHLAVSAQSQRSTHPRPPRLYLPSVQLVIPSRTCHTYPISPRPLPFPYSKTSCPRLISPRISPSLASSTHFANPSLAFYRQDLALPPSDAFGRSPHHVLEGVISFLHLHICTFFSTG